MLWLLATVMQLNYDTITGIIMLPPVSENPSYAPEKSSSKELVSVPRIISVSSVIYIEALKLPTAYMNEILSVFPGVIRH